LQVSDVLRVPSEPPIGTTVEAIGGRHAGKRWESQATVALNGPWRDLSAPSPNYTTWLWVLVHAGIDGVRVLPPNELRN